ncbi:MAG: DNA-directed RNA polymerase subunit beta, partial [Proteobacteria bacterium]|nr:DNA-directed RNA polymerase subunit beta [Pseudomonadota bacterium]
ETTIRERAIIKKGDYVKVGDPLYYQFNLKTNELSLGRNVLVAYMPFYGYNYEDAILISERLVKDDVYTSIHIEKYEVDLKRTKLGEEEFTKDIPNAPKALLEKLDDNGYIKIGSYIKPADILVGKVTPKGDKNLTPEERLLRAIFGNKAKDVKDTSYKVPNGGWGCVIDIKELTEKDELEAGVIKRLQIYVAKKKKIEVGDKMAGRHGNKGVVAKILPEWAMPHLEDGTPIDIVLNPLGVPSRMNIGQVLETQLGLLAKELGVSFIIPPFNTDLERLKELGIEKLPEKVTLIDGMTGEPFENKVTVGYAYMLKLHHLVDDKVHARSTGNYSFITQQPLGGKAQGGG